jgi:glutamine amidotransferase
MMNPDSARVCIIDYGSGNITSVNNIFASISGAVKVSNEKEDIENATHLVLPGVGAFGVAMDKIKGLKHFDVLQNNVLERKKKFLGICIGMQVLAEKGYEHGTYSGLGWISGEVKKLDSKGLPLPHVGWNNLLVNYQNPLLDGMDDEVDFYYVHSYYFDAKEENHVLAYCDYGMKFPAIINRENIYGVQFHPEKSQRAGVKLLRNFLSSQ